MNDAVNHDSVQFVPVRLGVGSGVLGHAFGRDEQITGYGGKFTVGERNDIGKGIVMQIFYVDPVQIVIGAEYII
jgi:hypothetical protein